MLKNGVFHPFFTYLTLYLTCFNKKKSFLYYKKTLFLQVIIIKKIKYKGKIPFLIFKINKKIIFYPSFLKN